MAEFRFKQFLVEQDNSAMKVNTDGVLLGAWMRILPTDYFFLDIGTGTGVIALMCAQRITQSVNRMKLSKKVQIVGIEIDSGAYSDACKNVANSSWPWIQVEQCAIQDYNLSSYNYFDLIFSNPPYFVNSLKSGNDKKMIARHNDTLSQRDLLNNVLRLLKTDGRFCLILPVDEGLEFIRKTEFVGKNGTITLCLTRLCEVYGTENKPPKRLLMEFVKGTNTIVRKLEKEKLYIHRNGEYSAEYKLLTNDFYL